MNLQFIDAAAKLSNCARPIAGPAMEKCLDRWQLACREQGIEH
jgi:hypothetical protein